MSQEVVLKIEGMTCNHCKTAVEKALQTVPGVDEAVVDLEKKQAKVIGTAKREELVKAVEDAEYTVVG